MELRSEHETGDYCHGNQNATVGNFRGPEVRQSVSGVPKNVPLSQNTFFEDTHLHMIKIQNLEFFLFDVEQRLIIQLNICNYCIFH